MKKNRSLKNGLSLVFSIAILLTALCTVPVIAAGGKKPKLSTPLLTCGSETNPGWIDITVCAGETGAPAGFSLQWMTCDEFEQHNEAGPDGILDTADDVIVYNQWYSSSDPRLCKASFSGNAQGHIYNLEPYECKTVRVGDLLLDNGASTNWNDVLDCGTCYVFRVFAHANSTYNRSDFTENFECSTGGCLTCYGALSQGGYANNFSCYVEPLLLGNRMYSADQLVVILNTRGAQNNTLTKLAKQLIAVKMSIMLFGKDGTLGIGNDCENEFLLDCIEAADLLIGDKQVLIDNVDTVAGSELITCLDNWIGEHHLPKELEPTPCK